MLTYLKLKQFKNFEDATLRLGPLTILVGTNAAGKSNLRDAFRFLHGIGRGYNLAEIIGDKYGEGGVWQWKGIRGGTREATYQGAPSFSLEVGFKAEKGQGSYFIEVGIGQTGTTPRVIQERFTYKGNTIFDSHPEGDSITSEEAEPEHILVRLGKGPGQTGRGQRVAFLNNKPVLHQLSSYKKLNGLKNKDDASTALHELESMRFLDLDPEALRRPSIPGQTVLGDKGENLSSVLLAICDKPESKVALANWIAELTPMDATDFEFPADQTGKVLVTLVERGGAKVSANSASDGTLRFLAMVAALLGKDLSRFYFFEELDNGIHPARLHLLLELIERQTQAGTIQMVATTHSPDLLGQLSPATLEDASLVYRLPETHAGHITPILELPDARNILKKQSLTRLHSTGWLEDAVFFNQTEEAQEADREVHT